MQNSLAASTGIITVDLGAISRNWKVLAGRVAPAQCAAVVKADCYGLGAARVVPALSRAGCTTFFVATPGEAEIVRKLAPKSVIYVLDGLIDGAAEMFARSNIRPALSSLRDVEVWAALCARHEKAFAAALHIDSGLHRLGLPAGETRRLVNDAKLRDALNLTLLMSHLASADAPRDIKNRAQLIAFEALSKSFPGVPRSLAASDGLMLGPSYHFELVRPGYALYGGQASIGQPAPVKPAVTLKGRILAVFEVAPGDTVGYSAAWTAKRPSRIATIAAGYADGVPRAASGPDGHTGGSVLINESRAPIVGRVSMDLMTVDITDIKGAVEPGSFATILGSGLTIEAAGHAAGTIGYEILTRLGSRFQRLYLDDEHPDD